VTRQAANGGGACSATDGHSQKQVCNSQEFPIACKGTWSTWSSCSAECGGGSQIRTYKVSSTSMFGGTKCDADEGQVQKTACNPQPCPINCMGKWSDFSSCSSTCGGGTQARTFSVTMKEQHGGQACPAQDGKSESQTCADKPCPIDSEGFWDEFGTCTKTCGGGSQTRAFKVTKPAAHGGKRSESEGKTENRVCGSNECPVTCSGEFSFWGACSKSCGGGSKSRSFVVKTKASFGGGKCADDGKVEHAPCNTNPCPSNCDGSWREWGACSATCGGGKQTRTYNIKTQASYGGNACPAVTDEDRVCNPNPCPTDCEGAWTAFTQCSQTCGNGQQARTFTVTKPAQHGGSACAAENGKTEAKTCSGRPCYYR
jgi:hemicentin